MTGTVNYSNVMTAIQELPFVVTLFSVGLFWPIICPHVACPPDGIALLDLSTTNGAEHWQSIKTVYTDIAKVAVAATVEIKTRITNNSLNSVARFARVELYTFKWSSAEVQDLVPRDYLCQVLHQCSVMNLNVVLY